MRKIFPVEVGTPNGGVCGTVEGHDRTVRARIAYIDAKYFSFSLHLKEKPAKSVSFSSGFEIS